MKRFTIDVNGSRYVTEQSSVAVAMGRVVSQYLNDPNVPPATRRLRRAQENVITTRVIDVVRIDNGKVKK